MRIRTIKPDFWESESLGKISREARLLFIGLFSCCDDSGRTRAASRLLASRLYPYDVGVDTLIRGWLVELEAIGAIRQYQVDGESYLEIPKWLQHQKIDRPTPSKIPAPPDNSTSPRESSRNVALEWEGEREREVHTHSACAPADLPVELPPGFPKTEAAAADPCATVGCPPDVAVEEWNLAMSRGGRDSAGQPIRSWAHYLRRCLTHRRSREAESAHRQRTNGGRAPSVVAQRLDADRRLRELRQQAATHPGNPDSPAGSLERKKPGHPDHEAWKALVAEAKRLQQEISGSPMAGAATCNNEPKES